MSFSSVKLQKSWNTSQYRKQKKKKKSNNKLSAKQFAP